MAASSGKAYAFLKNHWTEVLILFLAFFAAGIIIYVTPWGPWTGSDSVVYLMSAKNLVDKGYLGVIWGQGSTEALVHYPPMLSLLVAGLYRTGLDILSAMRVICAVSFGLLIGSVGLLSYRITRRSNLALQICAILMVAPTIFTAYTSAMSETLYFLFMMTALLLLLVYLENGGLGSLVGSAILAAGALLTRYIGVAVLVTCLTGILLLGRARWKRRLYDLLIFGIVSLGVSSAWFLWILLSRDPLEGRLIAPSVNLGIAAHDFLASLSGLIWGWLTLYLGLQASYSVIKIVIIFVAILGGLVFYLAYRRFSRRAAENLPVASLTRWIVFFGLATGVYLISYFLAYAFTIPPPAIRERIAFPILLTSIMAILGLMHLALASTEHPRIAALLPWVFTLILVAAYLPKTVSQASALRISGGGYTSTDWRESKMIRALRRLPDNIPIVTNEPDAVLLLTGREALRMSEALTRPVERPAVAYGQVTNDFAETVFRRWGALALFPSYVWQIQTLYGQDVRARLEALIKGLAVYKKYNDGSGIFFYGRQYLP